MAGEEVGREKQKKPRIYTCASFHQANISIFSVFYSGKKGEKKDDALLLLQQPPLLLRRMMMMMMGMIGGGMVIVIMACLTSTSH